MLSTQANQALPLLPLLIFSHFVAKSILIPLLIDCHQGQKAKDWKQVELIHLFHALIETMFWLFLPRIKSLCTPGSVYPSPIPPTPGQPCSQLPGALDCHYQNRSTVNCCCGQCDIDMTCAPDLTTGSGLWQPMHSTLCPEEGCGSVGEWSREMWKFSFSLNTP